MQNSSCYKILSKHKLVIEQYIGEFTLSNLISLKIKEEHDEQFNPYFYMVMDLSNVNINLSTNEVEKFITLMNNMSRLPKKKRVAIITQTPDQYVKTYLILEQTKLPIELTLVSSIEAALVWLGFKDKHIRMVIEEFKCMAILKKVP